MNRLSVSARLMLLILVAALPVLFLYVGSALQQRRQVLDLAEDQLLRSARLLAAQQDQFFLRARNVLSTMLISAKEVGFTGTACGDLLRSVVTGEPYSSLSIVNPEGAVICSSDDALMGANVSGMPFYDEAIATGDFAVGAPRRGEAADTLELPLALPSTNADGTTELVGVAYLDLRDLSETMALSRLPAGGVGIIFNAGRSVLARIPPGVTIGETVLAPVRPNTPGVEGEARIVPGESGDGPQRIWAVADLLPEQGLYVGIGVPVASLVADADQNLWRGMAILLGVFAIAALAAWLIGELTIRQPLNRLAGTVAALGGGDLSARIPEESAAPEFGKLAQGFNDMAGAIEDNSAQLKHRNERLNRLIDEKEMLVREMNHRIKNSLQLVSSLVGLQLGTVSDPDARSRLNDAQSRVAAVAKVHERLYAGERLDKVAVAPYLRDLSTDLAQTMGLAERGGDISLESVEAALPPDKVIPLGLITCELVTNAAKHGPADGAVHIEVSFEQQDGKLRLSVADNGPGLPEGFDPDRHPGLGMKVVRALAQQLGSRLNIEPQAQGTRFSVTFGAKPDEAMEKPATP